MTTLSEKRANETDDVYYKANLVLVDIEGTTTSIDFVKNTLFPYVRKNLEVYLKSKWNDEEFKEDLKLLQEQSKQDEADGTEGLVKIPEGDSEDICEDVKKNVLWQMDLDRKTKALKQLQGHIWRDAYKKGEVKAHVYPDVAPTLKSWKQSGKDIYVYSSGSVEAQKLLFGHTQDGDLLELFSGYFDTTVGPKVEESSYSNIVNSVKCKSEDIIFFTDVPKEARAAKSAGLQAVIVAREGNLPITDDDKLEFPVIKSFDDIVFETSLKRRKKSEDEPSEQGKTNSAVVDVSSAQDVEMQEEPVAVKTETSKATEGVSSSEMVEAEKVQPDSVKQTPVELGATIENAKQPSCKDKDTVNNDLANTKKTDVQGAAEVTKQKDSSETNSKMLKVNGAEKLSTGSDNKQTESNGPKCPKDDVSKTDSNNIDTPIKKSADASANSKDAKLNENSSSSSEKCNDASSNNLPVTEKIDVVVPDGKTDNKSTDGDESKLKTETGEQASTKSVSSDTSDSKDKVETVTNKTESTSSDTSELSSKTECTHTEKTEHVNAKTESATSANTEPAPVCKTDSPKPIDAEPVSKKTESEVKTEVMETDNVTPTHTEHLKSVATDKDEPVEKDKTKAAPEVEVVPAETGISAATDEVKDKATVPTSEQETPVGGNAEAVAEETQEGGKAEAAAEATPEGGKAEAAAEATPDGGKAEAAAEATPDGGKAEAAAEATPDGGKAEAAAEATPDGGKAEAAAEATPDGGKAEAAVATSCGDKDEAMVEATPDGGKAAAEATPVHNKAEAANSMDDGNVATVASDVKADSTATVNQVKVDNGTDVPMDDAEPMVTDDAEDVSKDKAKSIVKEESEPMVTDEVEPMATNETKPVTEETKHTQKDDSEPMATDEPEPMVTEESVATVKNKDETVNSKVPAGDSDKTKTAQAEKETKADEESSESTKNESSGSNQVAENTNCNSVNKDIAITDTNDGANTGKPDSAAKGSEALDTKTESSNTHNKVNKTEDQNVDNVKKTENEMNGKNGMNCCIENGESTEKTDSTSEKLKVAVDSADKVAENVVST